MRDRESDFVTVPEGYRVHRRFVGPDGRDARSNAVLMAVDPRAYDLRRQFEADARGGPTVVFRGFRHDFHDDERPHRYCGDFPARFEWPGLVWGECGECGEPYEHWIADDSCWEALPASRRLDEICLRCFKKRVRPHRRRR